MKRVFTLLTAALLIIGMFALCLTGCSDSGLEDGLVTVYLLSEYVSEDKTTSYTYDSNGNPVKYTEQTTDRNGEIKLTTTASKYDAEGNLIEQSIFVNGQETERYTYEYDSNGKMTRRIKDVYYSKYAGEYRLEDTYSYDEKGNLLELFETLDGKDHIRYTYTYDDAGNMTEEKYDYIGEDVHSRDVFEYTDNVVTEYTYEIIDGREKLKAIYVRTYDEYKNVIKDECYWDDDARDKENSTPSSYETWVYDSKGRVTEYSMYWGDKLHEQVTYAYNEYGDVVQYTTFEQGSIYNLDCKYEYTYDKNGNMTKKVSYNYGEISGITRYTYDQYGNMIEEGSYNQYDTLRSTKTYTYVAVRVTPERAEELKK